MVEYQTGRRVLITGGTGSVGRALVEIFSSNGDNVIFQYNSNQAVAGNLEKSYGATAIQLDFSKEFNLKRTDFDIIINNVGINNTDTKTNTHQVPLDDWNRTLLVNVTTPFQIIRLCLPSMIEKRWGRIINISSIYGLRAGGYLPYTVSKHALSGLTKTICSEYAEYGITCNEICPGAIESEMVERIAAMQVSTDKKSKEEVLDEWRSENPMGRLAMPQEVADLALFLASPKAGYLNGVSVPIDGGMIA